MKLIVEFEWDEKELGDGWFNVDNLSQCLFTEKFTKRELLKVKKKEIKDVKLMDKELKEVLAQVYCLPEHSHKVLDADLLNDIASAITKLFNKVMTCKRCGAKIEEYPCEKCGLKDKNDKGNVPLYNEEGLSNEEDENE